MTTERMSWWRAHHGLPSHPRWLQAARKSGKPVPVVFSVAMWLLDFASKAEERGSVANFDPGPCAAYLWIDEEDVVAVVDAFAAIGWLQESCVASWVDRQPKREDATAADRKKAQREREQAAKQLQEKEAADLQSQTLRDTQTCEERHAPTHGVTLENDVSRDVTQCHAPEKRREDKISTSLRSVDYSDLTVCAENSGKPAEAAPPTQPAQVDEPLDDPKKALYARGDQVCGKGSGGMITKLLKAKGGSVAKARAALETASEAHNRREYLMGVIRNSVGPPDGALYDRGL